MSGENLSLFEPEKPVDLEGEVERVIFHNEENGYSVLRLAPARARSGVRDRLYGEGLVCVGYMTAPRAGMALKMRGRFRNHPRFGRRLELESAEEIMPASEDGIRIYLASGQIRGVGPDLAAKIVKKFGMDTLRILDEEPEKLREVRGIGAKKHAGIVESWKEHQGARDLMLFLGPHGVSAAYAMRIFRAYGQDAAAITRQNPYRLAMDIRGIGFATADAIAGRLGFPPDHPLRAQGAALYVLDKASDEGHVFLPREELLERMAKETGAAPDIADRAIDILESDDRLVVEDLGQEKGQGVYLKRMYHCESKIAFYLKRLMNSPRTVSFNSREAALEKALASFPVRLAPEQLEAVRAAMKSKVLVITGGPGTGKTTIIRAILKVFEAAKAKIALAAPTGRAAKRMGEACGREAKTIHRLLEYSPKEDRFCRDEDNPLPCGLLVVDEASMMDTQLFYYLLKAVPMGCSLILVGDVDQLPSVGPGAVLADIIASRAVPVTQLNHIFRQSAESEIICSAHLINAGKMPNLESDPDRLSDFYFIRKDDPEEAADLIVDLVKNHIPRRFGLDAINDIQTLSPMRRGAVGADNLNSLLQAALNPNGFEIRKGDRSFRLHDKVMQVRNNYDKDIFNGDMGRIHYINREEKTLNVDFDGLMVNYEFEELDELVPAYAISIHKSQGSEYPAVVIPVMTQHYIMLRRNLIYTGVTRGKKLVVLVGEAKALAMAIRANGAGLRHTWLARRLARGL